MKDPTPPEVTIGAMEEWVRDIAGDDNRSIAAAVRVDLAAEGFDVTSADTVELIESTVSATLSNLFESFALRLEMAVADAAELADGP